MRIERSIPKNNKTALITISIIDDNGEIVPFTGRYYGKAILLKEGLDVFKHANLYLETLSKTRQHQIFNVYKKIAHIMGEVSSKKIIEEKLISQVTDLVDLLDHKHAKAYITKKIENQEILLPPSVLDEYPEEFNIDKTGTPDQTYLTHEYIDLLVMALLSKFIVPIWSEYIVKYSKELGKLYKEFFAFILVKHTPLVTDPSYEKLRRYITTIVNANRGSPKMKEKSLQGISEDDMVEWITRGLIVRKLPAINLSVKPNTMGSLITSVYTYARQKVTTNMAASDPIKFKEPRSYGSESGDRMSHIESYKIASKLPEGTVAELEFIANRPDILLGRTMKTPNQEELLNIFLGLRNYLFMLPINEPQLRIVQWVLGKYYNPEGILYINKQYILNLFSVAATYLWIHNFHFMSLFIMAEPIPIGEDEIRRVFNQGTVVPKDLEEAFKGIYSFTLQKGVKTINPVIEAINEVTALSSKNSWYLRAPEEMLLKVTDNPEINIPITFRKELIELLIFLSN